MPTLHRLALQVDHVSLHRGAVGRRARNLGHDRLMPIQIPDGVLKPLGGLERVKLRLNDDLALYQPQPAAETNHSGRLRLFRRRQFVIDCGQLAFDIIQKSQEPTSYVLFRLDVSPACWVLLPALPPAYCDT